MAKDPRAVLWERSVALQAHFEAQMGRKEAMREEGLLRVATKMLVGWWYYYCCRCWGRLWLTGWRDAVLSLLGTVVVDEVEVQVRAGSTVARSVVLVVCRTRDLVVEEERRLLVAGVDKSLTDCMAAVAAVVAAVAVGVGRT